MDLFEKVCKGLGLDPAKETPESANTKLMAMYEKTAPEIDKAVHELVLLAGNLGFREAMEEEGLRASAQSLSPEEQERMKFR